MFIVKTFEFFWRVARYNGGFDDLNMLVFCLAQISPQIQICQLKSFDAVITWCLAHSSPPSLISLILLTINLGFFLQIWVKFQTYCFVLTGPFWQRCEITLLSISQRRLAKHGGKSGDFSTSLKNYEVCLFWISN